MTSNNNDISGLSHPYSISGWIYQDINDRGYYSGDDIELGGITIQYSNGREAGVVVSRSDGYFRIPNLSEGVWSVLLPNTIDGLSLSYIKAEGFDVFRNNIKVRLDQKNALADNINVGYKGSYYLSGQLIARKSGEPPKQLPMKKMNLIVRPVDKSFKDKQVVTDDEGYYRVESLLPYEYKILLDTRHPFFMLDDYIEVETITLFDNLDIVTYIDVTPTVSIQSVFER